MARPKPRPWRPKNPEKYAGDTSKIVTRSSWETRVMNFLDMNPSVLMWNSEGLIIPYINPLDNKPHRYFVDFLVKMQTKDGTVKMVAIEVKPYKETQPPKHTPNKKRLIAETETYITNQAKWKYARAHCERKNVEFVILTENELGIK